MRVLFERMRFLEVLSSIPTRLHCLYGFNYCLFCDEMVPWRAEISFQHSNSFIMTIFVMIYNNTYLCRGTPITSENSVTIIFISFIPFCVTIQEYVAYFPNSRFQVILYKSVFFTKLYSLLPDIIGTLLFFPVF